MPTTTTNRRRWQRDAQVRGLLADAGIVLHTVKDHVVFERSEVLTQTGGAYSVFTPYKNAWLKKARRPSSCAPTRWRAMRRRWRRVPAGLAAACRR
jgi:deoxyribodipyrimidine photolyase